MKTLSVRITLCVEIDDSITFDGDTITLANGQKILPEVHWLDTDTFEEVILPEKVRVSNAESFDNVIEEV